MGSPLGGILGRHPFWAGLKKPAASSGRVFSSPTGLVNGIKELESNGGQGTGISDVKPVGLVEAPCKGEKGFVRILVGI